MANELLTTYGNAVSVCRQCHPGLLLPVNHAINVPNIGTPIVYTGCT